MSRLGQKPLPIPEKVKVEFKDHVLNVTGPLGHIAQNIPADLSVKTENNQVLIVAGLQFWSRRLFSQPRSTSPSSSRRARA